MQSDVSEAIRRIEEARWRKAETLDLGDLRLTELPPELASLPHLRRLFLGKNRPAEDGKVGRDLARDTSQLVDLAPLSSFLELQILDLSYTKVVDLVPLTGLTSLQSLYLEKTEVVDLGPLKGLSELQILALGHTKVVDLVPLAGLTSLQSLYLEETEVVDLGPLKGLSELQILALGHTKVVDLKPLTGLTNLQNLYLWRTGVVDLVPLTGLTSLQSLYLEETAVVDLRPLAGLQDLKRLNLSGCRSTLPASTLRSVVNLPHLTQLYVDRSDTIPREVLSQGYLDNCLPRLRAYFSELDLGAEAENEVKVILLGNGRAGKTQLCRRFRGEPFDESIGSTHGVQLWREKLQLGTGDAQMPFQVNWWDFGGQDIYHGTHALFLTSRALFLILWTPALENRNEDPGGEVPTRNRPLAYWLDYVRALAGKDSPLIVVQSRCDEFDGRHPDPLRPEDAVFFECCSYSAKTDLGREVLDGYLRQGHRYLALANAGLVISRGRAELRRLLYALRAADQERKAEERRRRTLNLEEFRALCDQAGGIVSWQHALGYLHRTGVVFYRPDLFDNCIVLDQQWALDAIYTVFDRAKTVPFLRDSGRFTREDLGPIAWQRHPPGEQRLFLGLMESCGICFRCGQAAQGEPRYIAPDLLPGFSTVARNLQAWNEEPGAPVLRLEYRFFHHAVIRGLMCDIGRSAGDLAEYWKYGFWFKDGLTASQALVQFEDTATAEAPGAGALVLKVQGGHAPLDLLRELRRVALSHQIGEPPAELLTLGGVTMACSALGSLIHDQALDLGGRLAPAAPFAAFFAERHEQAGCAGAPAGPSANGGLRPPAINPVTLNASDKPPEVFLSYAWGDDSPAGQLRDQTADRLQRALEADGIHLARDRDQIRSGERISAFIRRLTRADVVVTVISGKYLRSAYCMYEIYKVWQRCQGDSDELAERIVPVILPEVRIDSFKERVPYLEHWSQQAAALETLIRRPDLDPSRESWEEVRLVRQFAHHVDEILVFLQDFLVPRNLRAQFNDGFQAVRDAVHQRLGRRGPGAEAPP